MITLLELQEVQEISKRDKFLMKLQLEFEVAQADLLNQDLVPSLDVCWGKLLHGEQRLAI